MKMKKMAAALAASVVAASALSAAASATLVVKEGADPGLNTAAGMWLVQVFNVGNEAENKPATDYGIDLTKVAKIAFTVQPQDLDWFDGQMGGAVVFSCNGEDIAQGSDYWGQYNWVSHAFWGINDDALEMVGAEDQDIQTSKVGDYTYRIESKVFNNPFDDPAINKIGCMQVALQDWGSDFSDYLVLKCEVMDASGNLLISFDENGKATIPSAAAPAAPAAADDAAPAAPAAGNVDAATDSSKGSPDTGIADVAAIAGLAIVAAGAVVISKKRK